MTNAWKTPASSSRRDTDPADNDTPPTPTIEAALSELDERLRTTLAFLNGADDEVAELTLTLLPFGSRSALVGYGVIESNVTRANDEPVKVKLTSFGRELIAACGLEAAPTVVRERLAELDEARARYAASDIASAPVRAVSARRKSKA
jgi:hypothetical protein